MRAMILDTPRRPPRPADLPVPTPTFPNALLREERVLRSVANLTRQDGEEFMALAPQVPVRTAVKTYPLESANEALAAPRSGAARGAAVLTIGGGAWRQQRPAATTAPRTPRSHKGGS